MFILRWYKEADKNGKEIISKVYLRRKDQPRTYTLNKKDAKMVKDAVKGKETPV